MSKSGAKTVPVYSAVESRSSTVDTKASPDQTAAPNGPARASQSDPNTGGESQLARNRATSISTYRRRRSDTEDNGVTYKPMRAYESGGTAPRVTPGASRSPVPEPRSGTTMGTAPVFADDPDVAQEREPAPAPASAVAPYPTDEQTLEQQAAQQAAMQAAQDQLAQQQWMNAMARMRFMNEMRAQQMWMQQQQAAVAQQQYQQSFRRWMDGERVPSSNAASQQAPPPAAATEDDAEKTENDDQNTSARGFFRSIVEPTASQSQENGDEAKETDSLTETRSDLYGDLSGLLVDGDGASEAADEGSQVPPTLQAEEEGSRVSRGIPTISGVSMYDGDVDADDADDADDSNLAKQSSLFDINEVTPETHTVVASVPKARPTTSRTLSLGVLVEPCKESLLSTANPHTIVVTDPSTKRRYDYELDETTHYAAKDADTVHADLLDELSRHAREGHRTVLLTSVSDGAESGAEALVRSALCNLVTHDEVDAPDFVRVDASAVVIRRGAVVHNLLAGLDRVSSTHSLATYSIGSRVGDSAASRRGKADDDDSNDEDDGLAFVPMVAAANPVAGHWIADTNFVRLDNDRDVEAVIMAHISPWLHKSTEKARAAQETVAVFATVVQRKDTDEKMFLSSLLILVSRDPDEAYSACTRPEKLPHAMGNLFKRVGHGLFTVAACCVSSDAGASVRDYVMSCRSLQAVHNSSLLSGNVERYLTYAKTQHTKADKRLEQLRASNESPETIEFAEQALKIHATAVKDMQELVNDPRQAPVRFISDTSAKMKSTEKATTPVATARAVSPASPAGMAVRSLRAQEATSPLSMKSAEQQPKEAAEPAEDPWKELGDDTPKQPRSLRAVEEAAPREAVAVSPKTVTPAATPTAAPAAPAENSVSFADRRVHVVAMVNESTSGFSLGERERGKASAGDMCTTIVQADPRQVYTVDEAVSADSVTDAGGAAPFSQHVTALCRSYASGHNCALVSYDGRNNNLFESPAWSAVREAVRHALAYPTNTRDLRLSVTLLNGEGEAADLLVSVSDFTPITIVASPLFGPVVDGARLLPIYSENDVRELLFTVAANIGNRWVGDTCLHVTVVSSISTHADVMVASFKASIFGSHHRFCTSVLSGPTEKPITALHRQFTQGTAASVLLLGFNNAHDALYARDMIGDVAKLPQKMPMRDGSVRAFLENTRKSLEKRKEKASQATDETARHRAEKVSRKIESMMSDYEETLYEPATHFPKSYTNSSDSAVTGIASGARALSAGTRRPQQQVQQQQKLHPYLVIGLELDGSVQKNLRVNGRGVTWTATGENFDTDETVVRYHNRDSATVAAAFNNAGELERLASCARTGKSAAIFALTDVGGDSGGNQRTTPTRPVQHQPWWIAYRHALTTAVFLDRWESGSTVQLRAVVLQDKSIIHDYLSTPGTAADAETPAKIAVSPLFGSVVANATMKECKDASELGEQLSLLASRMNAYNCQRNNTTISIHALLRRVTRDVSVESSPISTGLALTTTTHDVVLSSLSATVIRVNHDLPALREILALDPHGTVPYALFRFPLTGTCRTVCLVDLDSCSDARAAESLRLAQRIRYFHTLAVPSGSVYNYISYESKRLDKRSPATASATSAAKQTDASTDPVSDENASAMLATMKTFFDRRGEGEVPLFPVHEADTTVSPKSRGLAGTSPTKGGDVASKRQACKTVVVVTSREVVSPSSSPTSAGKDTKTPRFHTDTQAQTVTMDGERHTYAEVTTRADNASIARPDLLRSAANNAIHGYNVALLMVDGTGSTSVSALLSRVINLIVNNKTERKLYLSMVALHHKHGQPDEVKDMLRVGDYVPLEVATSPLFGSCINGARFSQIKNTGDIFVTLRDALSVCAVEKSVLVMTLVMRQKDVLYSDVTVNSLTAVICTAENTPTGSFPGQFIEDTLLEPDVANRGLLKTCCGGQPYYTYGIIGLSGQTPATEAKRLLELGDHVTKLTCRFPRPSSALKLVEFAKRKLNPSSEQASTPVANGGEFIEEPNWDWDRIREDTEKMLKDEMCKPKAYVLE